MSDPQLMPTRRDGSAWTKDDAEPRLQVSIRLERGTARSKVVASITPSFALSAFNVAPGELVAIQLWELEELGRVPLGAIEFKANSEADTLGMSSDSVMLFDIRTAPVDVWSIAELSLIVPVRIDDHIMAVLRGGLEAFHERLHLLSRGQIRIARYRFYEMPSHEEARALRKHGVDLQAPGPSTKRMVRQGRPAAPQPMSLPPVALTSAGALADELLAAFETSVLGTQTLPEGAQATTEPGPIDPWRHVRVHFEQDLHVELLSARPSRRTTTSPRADIDIVRRNTVDASAGDVASAGPSLGADAIRRIVAKHSARLGKCLDQRENRQASIHFTVSGKLGRITELEVNGARDGKLHQCLLEATAGIQFPTSGRGQTHAHVAIRI